MFNLQLAQIRKANGYTQEQLAHEIGVSRRTLGAWERGDFEFPFDAAFSVCSVLGCTFDELAGSKPYAKKDNRTKSEIEIKYSLLDQESKAAIDEQIEFQRQKTEKRSKRNQ